jgi:hypothetical protein
MSWNAALPRTDSPTMAAASKMAMCRGVLMVMISVRVGARAIRSIQELMPAKGAHAQAAQEGLSPTHTLASMIRFMGVWAARRK